MKVVTLVTVLRKTGAVLKKIMIMKIVELDTETENFQQNSTIDTRSQEQEVSENAQTEEVYGAAPSQPSLPSPHEFRRFVGGSEDWKEGGEEEEDQQ